MSEIPKANNPAPTPPAASATPSNLGDSFTVDDIAYTFNQRASSSGFNQILLSRFRMHQDSHVEFLINREQKKLVNADEAKQALIDAEIAKLETQKGRDSVVNLDYLWVWAGTCLIGTTVYIQYCIHEFTSMPDIEAQKKARELALKLTPRLWPKLVDRANKAGGYGFLDASSGRISGL